jgi:DNA-binding NarL/FixJ family response regulator
LETRWQALSAASREVLAAVAWHDEPLRESWLAELAPDPTAVDTLVDARWMLEQPPGLWQLDPAFDRTAVRALVPWSARRRAHATLARILSREPAQLAPAAAHFSAAGLREEAGRAWLAAARGHCRRNHHRLAAESFAQAIASFPSDLPDDELVEAVRDFGTCAGLQRATTTALELIQTWRDLPLLAERTRFQAEAARVQAAVLSRSQRHVEAGQMRVAAADRFSRLGDVGAAASELVAAATTLAYALHIGLAEETAVQAMTTAKAAGKPDLEAEAAIVRGFCLGMRGETAAAREQVEAALDLALGASLTAQAADAYRILGNVQEYASCYHDVPEAFTRALSYCRRHGESYIADLCVGCLSYSLFRAGNWRKSAALARQVIASRKTPLGSQCVARWVLGLLQVYRGEPKPAGRNLAWSLDAARRLGIAGMELLCLGGEALAWEFAGADDQAAAAYRRLMNFWLTTEDRHDVVPGLTGAVIFFASRGESSAAGEFAAALQRIAAANPNPENIGASTLAAAELKLLEGKPDEAVASLADAVRAYEQRGLTVEILRARLRLASALAQAGDTVRAIAVLREARAQATRLGARPLAAQASARLDQLAGKRQASAPAPGESLSPRQREVARHLSAGRTNKEIAQALSLSVRTIDMHVAHLLARLDCRTRTAAVVKLASAPAR